MRGSGPGTTTADRQRIAEMERKPRELRLQIGS